MFPLCVWTVVPFQPEGGRRVATSLPHHRFPRFRRGDGAVPPAFPSLARLVPAQGGILMNLNSLPHETLKPDLKEAPC